MQINPPVVFTLMRQRWSSLLLALLVWFVNIKYTLLPFFLAATVWTLLSKSEARAYVFRLFSVFSVIHSVIVSSLQCYGSGSSISSPDPDTVLMTKNLSKIAIYFSLGLHKGHPTYRKSLLPSKENIQHFKKGNLFTFFYFYWLVLFVGLPFSMEKFK